MGQVKKVKNHRFKLFAKRPISSFIAGTPITRWPLLLWGLLETSLQEMTFRRRCVCVWTDVFVHHHVWLSLLSDWRWMVSSSSLFLCPRWCWTAPLSPASCTCSVAPRNPSGRRRAGPSPTSQQETEDRFRYTLTHTPHLNKLRAQLVYHVRQGYGCTLKPSKEWTCLSRLFWPEARYYSQ